MQTSWAHEVYRQTNGNVIIFAPLCVAQQTVKEGAKFGIEINYCRNADQVKDGLNISNYEMLEHFDLTAYNITAGTFINPSPGAISVLVEGVVSVKSIVSTIKNLPLPVITSDCIFPSLPIIRIFFTN